MTSVTRPIGRWMPQIEVRVRKCKPGYRTKTALDIFFSNAIPADVGDGSIGINV